jgi:hypothetical protein
MSCLKVTSLLLNKEFSTEASLLNKNFSVKASLLNKSLEVRCSLVCSIYTVPPLVVIPCESQWITLENPIVYNIITKKSWTIN